MGQHLRFFVCLCSGHSGSTDLLEPAVLRFSSNFQAWLSKASARALVLNDNPFGLSNRNPNDFRRTGRGLDKKPLLLKEKKGGGFAVQLMLSVSFLKVTLRLRDYRRKGVTNEISFHYGHYGFTWGDASCPTTLDTTQCRKERQTKSRTGKVTGRTLHSRARCCQVLPIAACFLFFNSQKASRPGKLATLDSLQAWVFAACWSVRNSCHSAAYDTLVILNVPGVFTGSFQSTLLLSSIDLI